jgi:hypothetical protein
MIVTKIINDWLPLPDSVLRQLDWKEGDLLELEVVGDALIVTRIEPAPKPKGEQEVKLRNAILALAGLLLAASVASAQPDYKTHVVSLSLLYPDAFACAHTGRSCSSDFATIVAIELHKIDPAVGANRKRGNGDFSQDALAIKSPNGDTTDINGGRSFVIDYIVDAGATTPRVGWASVGGMSGWVDPTTLVDPRGASPTPSPAPTPVPTPAPTPVPPTGNLTPLLDQIAQLRLQVEALTVKLDALAGLGVETRDQLAHVAERVEAAHVSVLEAINLGRQSLALEYCGRVPAFAGSITLRPCP